ncbi:MAG: GntR family transcriptional regulator [Hyphomicrobiaceae bacterium]
MRKLSANAAREPASAEAEAYQYLINRIRIGELRPGTRLRAEEIAAKIGMSRMPVREAFRRLDTEGYVTIRPNRGAIVTDHTFEEIQELFEIRSVLEGLAVRLAAERIGPSEIEEMHDLLRRMRSGQKNADDWLTRHWAFHEYICRLSGRRRLVREIERLHGVLEPYLRLWFFHANRPVIAIKDHQELLKVIEMRNPEKAEVAMREHVLVTAPQIIRFLQRQSGGAQS